LQPAALTLSTHFGVVPAKEKESETLTPARFIFSNFTIYRLLFFAGTVITTPPPSRFGHRLPVAVVYYFT